MANELLKFLIVNSLKKLNNFAVISKFISARNGFWSSHRIGFGDGVEEMKKKMERLA